ncbi:HAD-IIB family hydrolase [Marinomonas posidonica]|uniref:Mannosyl-3-phosphoglycerate phosphatase family n=1 Tax=Marinomonas posidonica (strain CECT 7376 / NCIMB 14433 / IVIA-Po-181) TaxID=491952 RepID=F6CT33_MARPP|nr:HAD-IIB family hydrolase [Marinomonas posidonica]AEF55091.1 mannosyl-3-phosphoglycerate phosphatase family [Marinomonas posidonica IVIA-Po-181]
MTSLLIFTDLDGTLLDHHTYSFEPAKSAMLSLKTFAIPCVINTSKTFHELLPLRKALNHLDPFIVENGSAVYIPKALGLDIQEPLEEAGDYWLKAFGPNREELIRMTENQRENFTFQPFSDMSVDQLIKLTGLSQENAKLAMQREFTEPMVWTDSNQALQAFRDYLEPYGVQIQKGGRFSHLMGKECDKANAMLWLKAQYQSQHLDDELITTMALGDGENDIGMLSKADIPVVIRSPVHAPPEVPNRSDAWLTDDYGPKGWAQAINQVLIKHGIL